MQAQIQFDDINIFIIKSILLNFTTFRVCHVLIIYLGAPR